MQQSQQGSQEALLAIVDIFNKPGNMGNILKKYFTPQEPQMSPEEQMFLEQQAAAGLPEEQLGPQLPQQPPSPQEALGMIGGP